MKKIFLALIFVCMLIFAFFSQPVKNTLGIIKTPESPMDIILQESGGRFYEIDVLAWTKLNSEYMEVSKMKNTLVGSVKTLYNTDRVPQFHIEDNYKACELNLEPAPKKSLQLMLQTYRPLDNTAGLKPESYFLVELAQCNKEFILSDLKKEVTEIYKKIGKAPQLTLTYTSKIKGRISSTEADDFLEKVTKILHLSNSEQVTSADYYSLTGYSKLFPDEIIIAGKKRNFSLSIRYNVSDNETYCIFGTPDIGGQN